MSGTVRVQPYRPGHWRCECFGKACINPSWKRTCILFCFLIRLTWAIHTVTPRPFAGDSDSGMEQMHIAQGKNRMSPLLASGKHSVESGWSLSCCKCRCVILPFISPHPFFHCRFLSRCPLHLCRKNRFQARTQSASGYGQTALRLKWIK